MMLSMLPGFMRAECTLHLLPKLLSAQATCLATKVEKLIVRVT